MTLLPHLHPITFAWAFVEAPIGEVLDQLCTPVDRSARVQSVDGTLEDRLRDLQPLSIPSRRRLLVETETGWTASFDNGAKGGEPAPFASRMSAALGVRSVAITNIPQTFRRSPPGSPHRGVHGAVRLDLFVARQTEWLNIERAVGVVNDGRWTFVDVGRVQPFEETNRYATARVRDRFDAKLLEGYAQHFGLDPFRPSFYGSRSLLIDEDGSAPSVQLNLLEARIQLGIE